MIPDLAGNFAQRSRGSSAGTLEKGEIVSATDDWKSHTDSDNAVRLQENTDQCQLPRILQPLSALLVQRTFKSECGKHHTVLCRGL